MNIACSSLVFDKKDYPQIKCAFKKIKELGFKEVDLAAFENWQGIYPSQILNNYDEETKKMSQLLSEFNLKVCSINANFSRELTNPSESVFALYKKEFMAILDFAVAIGSPNITIQPGKVQKDIGLSDCIDICSEHLKELAKLSKDKGVSISLEGHFGSIIEKPENAICLMEKVWPDIGFTYDPSHLIIQGLKSEDTECLLKYAMHVHIRNSSPGKMQDTIKNGSLNFNWLISSLIRNKYNGAISIEYFNGFDKDLTNTIELKKNIEGLIGADN